MRYLSSVVALAIAAACHATPHQHAGGSVLYVAVDGNDAWTGRLAAANPQRTDGPFATLARARAALHESPLPPGGAVIEVLPGEYLLREPLVLSEADSGTAASPIVIRAYRGVRLRGGRKVTNAVPLTDPGLLARLPEEARGHVIAADLRSLGIKDFGSPAGGGLELFYDDHALTLARWPNDGFTTIAGLAGNEPIEEHGAHGDKAGRFFYEGDRPSRWVGEPDAWLHGYWFWDWADERERIAVIDPARKLIEMAKPYHQYGYRKDQWFYAYNLLSELDQPGEWYLDRTTGTLVFWPPHPGGEAFVSMLDTLVEVRGASYVTIEGFELDAARDTAITVDAGTHVELAGLTIHDVGGWAIRVAGTTAAHIRDSHIFETGDGGIYVDAGDRAQLAPGNGAIENTEIDHIARWHRTHEPAIALAGVGQRVSNVHIHDVPHEAINFRGNDHVIERSEIDHACTETNDAGAIYGGRDWTMRGTQIRNNYLHDIVGLRARGSVGVYLDDLLSGIEVRDNLFYRVTRAVFIGGGRDNIIDNNVFVACEPALHVDARGLSWAAPAVEGVLRERLSAVPVTNARWRARYPALANLLADSPGAPKGNMISRNVNWGGRWDEIDADSLPLLHFVDNFLSGDPGFVDAVHLNFELVPNSPVFVRGIHPIPLKDIGLHR